MTSNSTWPTPSPTTGRFFEGAFGVPVLVGRREMRPAAPQPRAESAPRGEGAIARLRSAARGARYHVRSL